MINNTLLLLVRRSAAMINLVRVFYLKKSAKKPPKYIVDAVFSLDMIILCYCLTLVEKMLFVIGNCILSSSFSEKIPTSFRLFLIYIPTPTIMNIK